MNAVEFAKLLNKLNACQEAVTWAKGKSLAEVWETCERADWMLWLCGKMIGKQGWPTRRELVLAACDCAETALKYVPKGEERPAKAIETARKWARGKATIQEVRGAAYVAADANVYAASAYAAAAYAAADVAADAAYYAAAVAAVAAADASVARAKALKKMAELVRARLAVPR
jgi:hypothetical protein